MAGIPGTPLREIVESEEFLESKGRLLGQIGESEKLFEDVATYMFGLVLAKRPDLYPRVRSDLNVRLMRTEAGRLPQMRVWYTYDDDQVELLYIELTGDGEEEREED